jgi:hypothetical protein
LLQSFCENSIFPLAQSLESWHSLTSSSERMPHWQNLQPNRQADCGRRASSAIVIGHPSIAPCVSSAPCKANTSKQSFAGWRRHRFHRLTRHTVAVHSPSFNPHARVVVRWTSFVHARACNFTGSVVKGHGYFTGRNSLRAVRFESSWARALPCPHVP